MRTQGVPSSPFNINRTSSVRWLISQYSRWWCTEVGAVGPDRVEPSANIHPGITGWLRHGESWFGRATEPWRPGCGMRNRCDIYLRKRTKRVAKKRSSPAKLFNIELLGSCADFACTLCGFFIGGRQNRADRLSGLGQSGYL